MGYLSADTVGYIARYAFKSCIMRILMHRYQRGRKIDSPIMTGENRNVDYLRVTCERFECWVRATTMSALPAFPGAPSADGDHATF